jgi:hypothetical protein
MTEPRSPMHHLAVQPTILVRLILTAMALLALSGCSPYTYTQTAFQREAGDVASAFSAAATTLEQLHTDKLDTRYAAGSLVVYRQLASGADASLPAAAGAPDETRLGPVLAAVRKADDVLRSPCMDDDCDWQRQVDILTTARDALLEVSQ